MVARRFMLLVASVLVCALTVVQSAGPIEAAPGQEAPAAPANLSMAAPHTTQSLAAGSWLGTTSIDIHFDVVTALTALTPQVELEPANVPFAGQPNFTGAPLSAAGPATITVAGLVDKKSYHWQARVADASGNASQWVPFSPPSTAWDLAVDTDPPSTPRISSPTNPDQRLWYHTRSPVVKWKAADSGSGVRGYSFVVARQARTLPPGATSPLRQVRFGRLGDGVWIVTLRAQDRAGNWSQTANFRLQLDRQPARITWLSPKRIAMNPYKGPATFRFQVSKAADVNLSLFRVGSSKPVSTLKYHGLRAGHVTTVTWSGKDKHGNPFPKGYYFFSATALDRAQNLTHLNLGGIDFSPLKPHTAVTGQVLYPDSGKLIIVSLSREELYAYDGTKLVLQTLVTTGNPNLPTPIGHFTVMARYHPYEFISPWPEGSPYWYAPSLAQYALLFRAGGYFLHDAPWRGAFGPGTNGAGQPGTNYGGTHGCVNIPPSPMVFLWNWTPVGTPVYVVG